MRSGVPSADWKDFNESESYLKLEKKEMKMNEIDSYDRRVDKFYQYYVRPFAPE